MRTSKVLLAVTLAVPIAACGDDDDGGRLTRSAFIEQADSICEEEGSAVEDAGDELFASGEPDPEAVRSFLEDVAIPRVSAMVDRISDLEPPEEMAADVERLAELTGDAVDQMRSAAESDDPMSLFSGDDPFAEADALALELGLSDCSDDDEASTEDGG